MARSQTPPSLYTALADATAARVRAETRNERAQVALTAARDELANRTQAAQDAHDAIVDEQTARAAAQAAAAQNTANSRVVRAEEMAIETDAALRQAQENERIAQEALDMAGAPYTPVHAIHAPRVAPDAPAPAQHFYHHRWLRWAAIAALAIAILALLLGLWLLWYKADDGDVQASLTRLSTTVTSHGTAIGANTDSILKQRDRQNAFERRLGDVEATANAAKAANVAIAADVEVLKKKAHVHRRAAAPAISSGMSDIDKIYGMPAGGCGVRLNGVTFKELLPRVNSTCARDRASIEQKFRAQCLTQSLTETEARACGAKLSPD